MNRTSAFVSLLLLLVPTAGCRGTLQLFGVGDDDDVTADDDDVTGDDDDATGDDDDATGDDDDDDDDDDSVCAPDWTLDCGKGSQDSYNNGGDGSTQNLDVYSCFDAQWTGPEYTYTYVAESSGTHAVSLTGFQDDLDLFVLTAGNGGVCSGSNCLAVSGNAPGQPESLTFEATAGATYYIVVDGFGGAVSDFDIELDCAATGDDDDATGDDDDATGDDDDSTPGPECGAQFMVKPHQASTAQQWVFSSNGWTGPFTHDPPGDGTVWGAVAGDFNGDGSLDIITERQGQQGIVAHLFAGSCNNDTFTTTNITSDNRGFTFAGLDDLHGVADLDQDGDLDVVGIEFNSGVGRAWLNGGDGLSWTAVGSAFTLPSWDPSVNGTHESVSMPPADANNDQIPDLIECSNQLQSPSSCTIHTGSLSGVFSPGPTFSLSRLVNSVTFGDYNGDGAVDVLGGLDDDGDAGQVWMWAGNPFGPATLPSGSGVAAFDVNTPDQGGGSSDAPGYGWMFSADIDGDGDLDVVITYMDPFDSVNQTMKLATNDGNANFTLSTIGNTTSTWGGGDTLIQASIGVPVRP